MDGFMWPHHPRTAQIKRFLLDGGIGEVRRVTASFTFALPPDPNNIRLQAVDERIRSRLMDKSLVTELTFDRAQDYRPHNPRRD